MRRSTSGKMLTIVLASILIFSICLQVTVSGSFGKASSRFGEKHISLSFPLPRAMKIGQYDWLKMENCSFLTKPGQPMLPIRSVTIKLPEKSIVTNMRVNLIETPLDGRFLILPAPAPTILGSQTPIEISEDPTIYTAKSLFPKDQYFYREAHGIDGETNTRVKYLILNLFPLRYLPTESKVIRAEKATIDITYLEPKEILASQEDLKNVIITSPALESYALELARWKNDTGIPSKVLNTTWIYGSFDGVDDQEKIRNCIKDLVATHGIVYVTIFGDVDHVPVRYVYVPDGEDIYTPTDLYYADLDGTWDDNSDGVFADQGNDTVDGFPDVYVGRIPPSLAQYAQASVDKIKGYQKQFDTSQNWTRRIILAAGTGHNGVEDPFGVAFPYLKDYIANIISDKDVVKLYQSYGNLSTNSMASQINRGSLFLNFAGHGDPGAGFGAVGWLFYWVITGLIWNGFGIADVQKLTNGLELPVVTTSACSTARFDDTDCIGEWFVLEPDGGAIAYFGATRIAWGLPDDWSPYGVMGEVDRMIYESFYEGHTRLGGMWGETIRKYVQGNIWDYGYASVHDVKTFMEFVLLGDPTLRVYNPDYPETLHVPQEYPTIQTAINAAYDGDTILVSSGAYHEHVIANRSVSIIGENHVDTVVDGNGTGTVIQILSDNVVVENLTMTNGQNGILLREASNCSIISSHVTYNIESGIRLEMAHNNTITDNNTIANSQCGIQLVNSSNNFVFHNDFFHNTIQICSENSTNTWDDGYPSGGNYWNDFADKDRNSGKNQDELGSDSIWDHPYVIDAQNRDHYPLVNPLTPTPLSNASLVVRGLNNRIYYRIYKPSGEFWGEWGVIPSGTTCDGTAAAEHSGKLFIVVRGMDGHSLWFGSVNLTDNSFSGWIAITGATPSAPTLVQYDSQLVLVVRGLDSRIYYRIYNCTSEEWEAQWTALLSGTTSGSPAATILGDKLHIVVRGFSTTSVNGNNSLWYGSVDLSTPTRDFTGWTYISGSTPSAPTLTGSQALNRLYLVVRGLNDVIYYNIWNSSVWEGWTGLPSGATSDGPAATKIGQELHIVVRGVTGTSLWHCYVDLSTEQHYTWEYVSGATQSKPTLEILT